MPALPPIYFERLLEDSPDIVVAVDRHGEVVFYNDGARTALGYLPDEVLGRHVDLFYPTLEEARSVMRAMRDPTIDTPGKVRNFRTTLVTSSGEHIAVAVSGSLIYDANGQEIGSIGFAKDLREIHRQDRLATLGEIAVGVAHEVNNPLAAIMNNVALLGHDLRTHPDDSGFDVQSERLDSIERSVVKIRTIVNRLAEMAGGGEYETREYLHGARMTDLSPATVEGASAGRDVEGTPRRAGTPETGQTPAAHDEPRSSSSPPISEPPSSPGRALLVPSDHPLEGLRVLVVDDDLAVCQSVGAILETQGCTVTTASSGAQAADILAAQHTFDMVLSDVVMPDVDGYELYMLVRKLYPETPVVLMTAFFYDRDHILKRSKLAGLDGILFKKPVDPARLVAIVRERCGR